MTREVERALNGSRQAPSAVIHYDAVYDYSSDV